MKTFVQGKWRARGFRSFGLVVMVLSVSGASAADYTWTGATNNTWSTAGNWGGAAPVNAATTSVFFGAPASGRVSPNLTASVTVGAITFNSGASAFTISRSNSNTLTLADGGSVTNNSTNLQTLSTPVVLGGATTWNAANGNLNVIGTISGAGGSITKTGAGTLTISGTNTYTGGTTISAGRLTVGNGGRLGTGGVVNYGVLAYNNAAAVAEGNIISGSGSLMQIGGGVTSLTATNTYQGGTTISGGVLQFSSLGNFGSGAVALNGGALRWAAGNMVDVSGIITLGGGALDTNGNDVSFDSAIAGSAALVKSGAGTLTLNAAPAGATSVTITGGTLRSGSAVGLPSGLGYTLAAAGTNGTATLDLSGYNLSIGTLAFGASLPGTGGANTVTTGTGVLTLGGNVSYAATNSPGTASITGNLNLGSGTRTFDIADSENTTTELTIGASLSGGGLNKVGTGVLALTGNNSHTGGTTVSYGVLQFSSSANFGSGPLTINGFYSTLRWAPGNTDGLAGGLTIGNGYARLDTNGNDVTLAATISGSGRLTKEGEGTLTIGVSPTLTALFVHRGTLRLSADNALPSVGNVTVNGTANDSSFSTTLDLNGHNLSIGSLDMGAYYSGRNAANVVTTGAGTLTIAGNVTYAVQGTPYEYYDAGTALIAGKLNLTAGTHAFNIADSFNTNFELNVTADVSGAGGINKTGPGNLVMGGTNTYSGNTIISGGMLRAILPTTSNLQMNGGVFEIAGDRSFVYGSGAGQIRWTGGGGGFSAYGGSRTVDITDSAGNSLDLVWGGGAFVADGTNLILSSVLSDSTVSLENDIDFNNANRSVTVNNGTATIDAELNGVLSNGGLAVDGNGTLKLTGANTYAGGTLVSGPEVSSIYSLQTSGAVLEFSQGSLGSGPVTLNNGSQLRWAAGNTDSLTGAAVTVGSGGATINTNGNDVVLNAALGGVASTSQFGKTGEGILTLNAPGSVFQGFATISGGTLRLGSASAFGTSDYGYVRVNAQAPGGSATFDTNGYDFYAYSLNFGGENAQANTTNTVSTGTGTILFTAGGLYYDSATLAANDPGSAYFTGNFRLYQYNPTFAIEDSTNTTTELTISANISSNGTLGFTKSGAGTLVLSGNNTYTGGTTHSGGTLAIGSNTAVGTGTLALGSGTIRSEGSSRTLGNAFTFTNNTVFGGASDLTFSANYAFAAARTINVTNSATTTFGGVLSGSNVVTKSGAGTLMFSSTANTYTGRTAITAGTLAVTKLDNVGAGRTSSLGAPTTVANGTINIGATTTSAALKYTGATNSTTDRVVNLAGTTGGATLDASGTGTITFTSAFTATGAGLKTLFLTGSNTGANTIGGAIVDNSASNRTSVEKSGVGTWVLGGANLYTGPTTINGGELVVNGSLSLNSSVAINNGAMLSGGGIVGAVAVNSGGTISPGNSPGMMTTGSETWSGGGTYEWEMKSANGVAGTEWDMLDIQGTLTISGTAGTPFIIDVISLTAANGEGPATGFSTDANYSWMIAKARDGIDGFDPEKFLINTGSFANDPNGSGFTISQVGNNLMLNYTAAIPEPSTFILLGAAMLGTAIRRRR